MTSEKSPPLHIRLLRDSGLDGCQILEWMNTSNAACGGRTPQQIVDDGRAADLEDALYAAALGTGATPSTPVEQRAVLYPRVTVSVHAFGADLILTEGDDMTIRQMSWDDLVSLAREGTSVGSAEDLRLAMTRQARIAAKA